MSLAGMRSFDLTRSGTLIARPKQDVALFRAAKVYHKEKIIPKRILVFEIYPAKSRCIILQ